MVCYWIYNIEWKSDMNFISLIMVFFSVLGAVDRIIGNKFGLGKEFERGFMLLGSLALTMIGMIVISPIIIKWLLPVLNFISDFVPIDSSIFPASLFANDMGGALMSCEIAKNTQIGNFNGFVVASMMGCTISFTVPIAFELVPHNRQKDVIFGLLCGIITIPIGCFVAGIAAKISMLSLLINLVPLTVFAIIIVAGLWVIPNVCISVLSAFGKIIKIIITIGLIIGIVKFLTGYEIIKGTVPIEDGAYIVFNAGIVMTGAFPFLSIISRLLEKALKKLGDKLKINEISAMGFVSTLATSITTFDKIKDMDKKGAVINAAFIVSASFALTDHLAFTLAYNCDFVGYVILGKLISGILAVIAALTLYKHIYKKD